MIIEMPDASTKNTGMTHRCSSLARERTWSLHKLSFDSLDNEDGVKDKSTYMVSRRKLPSRREAQA